MINNKNNEKIYYYKLADELIRYDHIRNYVFTNDTFLSFDKIKYNVNKDEIVLLEELLNNLLDNEVDNVKQKQNYNTNLYDNLNADMNVSNTYTKKELEDKINVEEVEKKVEKEGRKEGRKEGSEKENEKKIKLSSVVNKGRRHCQFHRHLYPKRIDTYTQDSYS